MTQTVLSQSDRDTLIARFKRQTDPVKRAELFRKEFLPNDSGDSFPVVSVANQLGIDVYVEDLERIQEGLKGYIAIKHKFGDDPSPKTFIVTNKNESRGHQRWTVAHELWHYIQHKDDNPSDRQNGMIYAELSTNYENTGYQEEADANLFSTSLLMPEDSFKSTYNVLRLSMGFAATKKALSDFFEVSETAVDRRIRALNLSI